ncbi:MAG: hypothetical protein KAJ51_17065, partial [Thermoplasmata archaeon]|nr:hypothetical protein [Thermoplasmata archaeon]
VWDTTTVPDDEYRLSARVYDGELSSETFVNLRVENGKNSEPIVDITTPYEEEIVNGSILIRGTVNDPDNQGIEELQIRIGRDMDWTNVPLRSKNGTVDWYYQWESTGISDGPVVISAKAYDGLSWSAPVNRKVEVKNGIGDEIIEDPGKQDKDEEINYVLLMIIVLIVAMIIVGLAGMGLIIRRGRKQIREYVPDGRLEPLTDVEAKLRPALGQGVSIEHAPALPAAPAGVTGVPMATPGLPPAMPIATPTTTTAMPMIPTLPAAAPPVGMGTGLPALPPATGVNYGIYSPQAAPAQSVPPVATAKYQPAPGATPTTAVPTAQTTTPTATPPDKLAPISDSESSNTSQ